VLRAVIAGFYSSTLCGACAAATAHHGAASSGTVTHGALPPAHTWKMVAQTDTQVTFIDLKSLRTLSTDKYEYWALMTHKETRTIYSLIHVSLDCRQKVMRLIEGFQYTDGNGQSVGATGPMTLPPESAGERQWLYVCEHQDKYGSVQRAYSIEDANSVTASLQSPDSDLGSLLNDSDLAHMATDYDSAQRRSGAIGVEEKIERCYAGLKAVRIDALRKASAYCVTLDIVGHKMDDAFRQLMKEKFSKDIGPVPYYEESTFTARLSKYLPETTIDGSTPSVDVFSNFADRALAAVDNLPSH
jgi:hypothetical protein